LEDKFRETKLVPLTPDELNEARKSARRRMPPGLKPGPLDLNLIISLGGDFVTDMTESQKIRIEKKRARRFAKYPHLKSNTKGKDELCEAIALVLGDGFSSEEVAYLLTHYKTSAYTLYMHVHRAINANREVERGPANDRRVGSQAKIIKWDWREEGGKFHADFQMTYQGWHWTKKKQWIHFPGPTFPLSHIDFLRFRFREKLLGLDLGVIISPIPSTKSCR